MFANSSRQKAVVLVLVVFLLGAALGMLLSYVAGGRAFGAKTENLSHEQKRARMVDQLTRDLSLTADQQKQLEAILASMQAEFQAIHNQMRPQFEQVRQRGRDQIRAILTPEQRPKFEEFMRRIDEERKKKSGH